MSWIGGIDQPVEKLSALAGGIEEQPILRRGQPQGADMIRHPPRRRGFAVDPHDAPTGARGLQARSDPGLAARTGDQRRDGPGPSNVLARQATPDLGERRAPQPSPGRQ
jgi:hypothetical protein